MARTWTAAAALLAVAMLDPALASAQECRRPAAADVARVRARVSRTYQAPAGGYRLYLRAPACLPDTLPHRLVLESSDGFGSVTVHELQRDGDLYRVRRVDARWRGGRTTVDVSAGDLPVSTVAVALADATLILRSRVEERVAPDAPPARFMASDYFHVLVRIEQDGAEPVEAGYSGASDSEGQERYVPVRAAAGPLLASLTRVALTPSNPGAADRSTLEARLHAPRRAESDSVTAILEGALDALPEECARPSLC